LAHLYGTAVCSEALCACKGHGHRSEASESRPRHFLHGNTLHKIGGRKPCTRAPDTAGWQDVIRPGRVIAKSLSAPVTEKNAPGRRESLKVLCGIARQGQMFGRESIDELSCSRNALGKEYRAVSRE
jgi:hypothetical protein